MGIDFNCSYVIISNFTVFMSFILLHLYLIVIH